MESQRHLRRPSLLKLLISWMSTLFLWLMKPSDHQVRQSTTESHLNVDLGREKLAEIDGGPIENTRSVFEHIEEGLLRNPERNAVICLDQDESHLSTMATTSDSRSQAPQDRAGHSFDHCLTLTYRQLHHTALNLAAGMLASGVIPNSTVLMMIPNGGEYALMLWVCALLRITYVCVDESVGDAASYRRLKEIMRSVKPSLIVVSNRTRALAVDFTIADLTLATPLKICLVGGCRAGSGWKSLLRIMKASPSCTVDPQGLLKDARNDDPSRVNSVIFTSGTSGMPKGCPLRVSSISHILNSQAWLINNDNCARALQAAHNSRGIALAQTLQTWKAGGAVMMTGKSYDVAEMVDAIQVHRPSFLALPPAMVYAIRQKMQRKPFEPVSGRFVQVGGDAVTRDCLSECTALFPQARVFVNHGMTEGAGSFMWPFFDTPLEAMPRFGELCPIGKVASGSTVRVWCGSRVARRCELGELHIKGSNLLRQYMCGESEASFLNDEHGHWFVTGDTAMIDQDGVVFILGRTKDMVSRGSMVVVPAAIESFLHRRLKQQTVVVSIPFEGDGQEPCLIVKDQVDGRRISRWLRAEFGTSYAVRYVFSLQELGFDEMPRSGTGKMDKTTLQKAVMVRTQNS